MGMAVLVVMAVPEAMARKAVAPVEHLALAENQAMIPTPRNPLNPDPLEHPDNPETMTTWADPGFRTCPIRPEFLYPGQAKDPDHLQVQVQDQIAGPITLHNPIVMNIGPPLAAP